MIGGVIYACVSGLAGFLFSHVSGIIKWLNLAEVFVTHIKPHFINKYDSVRKRFIHWIPGIDIHSESLPICNVHVGSDL